MTAPDIFSSTPICTALLFWMARMVCFSVTWMISWPSTPASSDSVFRLASAPLVMWTKPPGAAKAFTASVSSTMNCHFRLGRELACAREVPTSATYLCTAAFCTTP